MRGRIVAVLLVLLIGLSGCAGLGAAPAQKTLTVFAAASLTDAFGRIGREFEAAHPGVTVIFNYAGSNQLAQQLGQGAPADLFASANEAQMAVAVQAGRVVSGTTQIFARNRLVLIYPTDNPGGITTLQDLAKPGHKIVLAAQEVPAGRYALDFLHKASQSPGFGPAYEAAVLRNVVSYEENVKAVLSKVILGEADAGIVYGSDVSGSAAEQVGRLEIPADLNTLAAYPIATVENGAQPELARAFVGAVLAPAGQAVLLRAGFLEAGAGPTDLIPRPLLRDGEGEFVGYLPFDWGEREDEDRRRTSAASLISWAGRG